MSFVGDVIGAFIESDSNRAAANTQADATRESVAEQRRQYDLTRSDYAPWRESGINALSQLQAQMGKQPTSAEVMATPGYQFGLEQGKNALARQMAAAGGRVSGAAIKAGTRYATDYATTKYNDAYSKTQDNLNRLAALAGLGQTATAGTASAGQNSANNISALISSQGDAAAAAKLRNGSIWGNTATKAIGGLGNYGGWF